MIVEALRRYWREEFVLAGCLAVLFAAVAILAQGFPRDARLFPTVVGTAGALLSVTAFAIAFRARRRGGPPPDATAEEAAETPRRLGLAVLSPPLFGLVLWIFGFYVASFLAALVMPPLMGYPQRRVLLPFAVVTVVATALLFPVALDVSLPHGLIGDWLIDRFYAEG